MAEWASASQHAQPTHRASAGTAGTFGVPAGVSFERERFRCRAAHSSGRFRSGRATKHAKVALGVRNGRPLVCSGFALTRLQNLVSGVWLERRASVVAEASGRGLAHSGSHPLWAKRRRELDPMLGTTERGDQRRAREGLLSRGRCFGPGKSSPFTHCGGGTGLGRTGGAGLKSRRSSGGDGSIRGDGAPTEWRAENAHCTGGSAGRSE